MSATESPLINEQTILRNELQELKKCQIQYFLISLGVTGAVFGFNKEALGNGAGTDMVYLVPLLVILPCWLTFFDKANTITRLTGYIRVFIEQPLLKNSNKFIGYETALSTFRIKEKKYLKEIRKEEKSKKKDWASIFNPTRHQYWKINWLTFLFLSLTCGLFPFIKNKNFLFHYSQADVIVFIIFASVGIIAIIYSFWILWRLIVGRYSYEHVKKVWQKIFDKEF